MQKNWINEVGELKFLKINDADNFKEVCLGTNLPEEMVKAHNLTDYDISVKFYDEKDSEISVLVYDNVNLESALINFSNQSKVKIIEFAEQHIQ